MPSIKSPPRPGKGYCFSSATSRFISVRQLLQRQLKKVAARKVFVSLLRDTSEHAQAEIFSERQVNSFLHLGHIFIFPSILQISLCLECKQFSIFPFSVEEFLVRSTFNQFALLQYQYPVSHSHGRKPVRYQNRCFSSG